VLVELPGTGVVPVDPAHPAEPLADGESVRVRLAAVRDATLEGALDELLTALVVPPVVQEPRHAENEFVNARVRRIDRLGGEHVREQRLVAGPVRTRLGVVRFAVREQGVRAVPKIHPLPLVQRSDQHGLDQPMDLQRVGPVVDPGQAETLDVADRPAELERVAEQRVELRGDRRRGRTGEQSPVDRLRCEEGADLQKLQCTCIDIMQFIQ